VTPQSLLAIRHSKREKESPPEQAKLLDIHVESEWLRLQSFYSPQYRGRGSPRAVIELLQRPPVRP
jgi:hypothetical protein